MASAALMASTTALEVTVAPESASTSSPRTSGADLPMNRSVNSGVAQFWPKPGVWVEASTSRVLIFAFSSSVIRAITSPPSKVAEVPTARPSSFAPGCQGVSSAAGAAA